MKPRGPRSPNAIRLARRRERARAAGICGQCYVRLVEPGTRSCSRCREAFLIRVAANKGPAPAIVARDEHERDTDASLAHSEPQHLRHGDRATLPSSRQLTGAPAPAAERFESDFEPDNEGDDELDPAFVAALAHARDLGRSQPAPRLAYAGIDFTPQKPALRIPMPFEGDSGSVDPFG